MGSSHDLGPHFEAFIRAQVATGRYEDAREVVRDALRLLEERERKLAWLDEAIARGVADADAGRVHDLGEVCDELDAELAGLQGLRSA